MEMLIYLQTFGIYEGCKSFRDDLSFLPLAQAHSLAEARGCMHGVEVIVEPDSGRRPSHLILQFNNLGLTCWIKPNLGTDDMVAIFLRFLDYLIRESMMMNATRSLAAWCLALVCCHAGAGIERAK
jgi:hypothetical protein